MSYTSHLGIYIVYIYKKIYIFLFLYFLTRIYTYRSISQDAETKEYLFEMLQNLNGFSLPLGNQLFKPNKIFENILLQ